MKKLKKLALSSSLTRSEMRLINGKGCYEHYKCGSVYITKVCGQTPSTPNCIHVGTSIDGTLYN